MLSPDHFLIDKGPVIIYHLVGRFWRIYGYNEYDEAAMVQSLDPCDPNVRSGFLAGVSTCVQ